MNQLAYVEIENWSLVRRFLPYCLKQLEGDRYIVLNRDYKPLGYNRREAVVEAQASAVVVLKNLTDRRVLALSHKQAPRRDLIHLYDDTCNPAASAAKFTAYAKRLAVFRELTTIDSLPRAT